MMEILAAPHVRDRETALALLKQSRQLPTEDRRLSTFFAHASYAFTSSDIEALVELDRADLAELILASSSDTALLEQVGLGDSLSFVLVRGLGANPRTPLRVLLHLSGHSSKQLSSWATRMIGTRIGSLFNDLDSAVEALRQIVGQPVEALLDVLQYWKRILTPGDYDSVSVLALRLFTQAKVTLPADVVEFYLSALGEALESNSSLAAAYFEQLDKHGVVPDELTSEFFHAPVRVKLHPPVTQALLSNLSREDLTGLLRDASLHGTPDLQTAILQILPATVVEELFADGGELALYVSRSSALSSATVLKWATQWVDSGDGGGTSQEPVWLLAHPAVPSEVLQSVLEGPAGSDPRVLQYVMDNPRATPEQLWQAVELSGPGLASDLLPGRADDPETPSEFLSQMTQMILELKDELYSVNETLSRRTHTSVLRSILQNPNTPLETIASMPAHVLARRPGAAGASICTGMIGVVRLLEARFPNDMSAWREFFVLLPDWEGALGELADALKLI